MHREVRLEGIYSVVFRGVTLRKSFRKDVVMVGRVDLAAHREDL